MHRNSESGDITASSVLSCCGDPTALFAPVSASASALPAVYSPSSDPVSVTVNSIERESEVAIDIENATVLDAVSHF
jgi:hypothetical protein